MTTRIVRCCTLLVSTFAISISSAQEAPSPSATSSPSPSPLPLGEALFKNLKARSIGPAVMGGRVSDIAIDLRNPFVFYVGLGHGGVFKTNDNGVTFQPIFDKQPMLSIGAVAVAPSDSDVVWVGTGEANDRNSSGWGDGVYRSTDGGETWQNVGLKESRTIARIIVDPKKPEVAYVAAMGNLWKDGAERGLFKTTDAGKTWKLILHAAVPHDARTGSGDVALDPGAGRRHQRTVFPDEAHRCRGAFAGGREQRGGAQSGGGEKRNRGHRALPGFRPALHGRASV
jgi:hypothetical protein